MATDSRRVRRLIAAGVVGGLYLLVVGFILFWPTTVTGPLQGLLAAAGAAVPYGDKLLEVGANVLLFLPAGWLAGSLLPKGWRWLAIVGGILVSSGVELAQALLLPGRVPSPRDVLANSLGVALGVLLSTFTARARVGDVESEQSPAQRPRRRWVWVAGSVVTGLLVAGIALGAWVVADTLRARDALSEVADAVPQLMGEIREQPVAAASRVTQIQDAAARAEAATTGPQWTVAGWLPWIGDNTRALQTVTTSVDTLASRGLPGLATAVASVTPDRLAPKDGRIDTRPLVEVRDAVVTGSDAVAEAYASVAGIDRGNLMAPVADAVERLQSELADADALSSSASAAVQLIPLLLGADGPRNWLVLAQNNAELRATGGAPGAALLLLVNDGEVDIAEQRSTGGFGPYSQTVLPLTDAEESLFGPELGLFVQDVNLTPDFPRTAELAATMWQRETGQSPQNVLSLDPVALANLLTATGPVEFQDPAGATLTLTAEDAAGFLMSEVYTRYERPEEQDAVFALASQAVLRRLMSSRTDPAALVRALADTIAQGRLLIWSSDDAEQALLEQAGASGVLRGTQRASGGTAPRLGVFLNLTTSSKTGYYLDSAAETTLDEALPDGTRRYTLRVGLTSSLQPGQAETLPEHVKWGNRDGTIRVNVLAYAPTGGTVTQLSTEWRGFVTEHDGLQVSAQTVKVAPSQTVELSWHVTTGPDQPGDPVIRLTPGARNP